MNRLEQSNMVLVLVLTDGYKRESVMKVIREILLDGTNAGRASPEDSNVFMFVDQQEETILESESNESNMSTSLTYHEEEFDPFEQLQRYCLLNTNKFMDCVEYWADVHKFGPETPLPPYNSSDSVHIGPSFLLMDLDAKDSCGVTKKLHWNFLSSEEGLSDVAFKLPNLIPEWKMEMESICPSEINAFTLYNPRVKKSTDIYAYRQQMRATKARRLKIEERVSKQRFQTLYYDLVDFMKLHPQNDLPKDKIPKCIRLLTGENIPEFAPSHKEGLVLLYYTTPNAEFDVQKQDLFATIDKIDQELRDTHSKDYKIWFVPDLPLDEALEDVQLSKEVNYILDRFQDIVEPYAFEIIDKCFEETACVRDLLRTRPQPPILVALNLYNMKHLVAVDYAAGVNVENLEHRPLQMLKMWANMLDVRLK
eukprot:CAMPEP_0117435150 /NCGR_PEP_ID=MMETSP0759-20121206/328_1 /TAXON_ID=63605 /ORGANISM="Percolomonas cosmopolitus, Strain WS" /LENGTH=422 /DNA_ID=CAMNT_0005226679 /DNA_START=96 /DNA_END=1364 /DNA_ORIENTATION=-